MSWTTLQAPVSDVQVLGCSPDREGSQHSPRVRSAVEGLCQAAPCKREPLLVRGRGAALALRAFSDLEGRQRDIWMCHKVIRAAAKAGTKRHAAVWEGDMSSAQGSAADKTLSTDGMSCAVRGRPHPSPLLRWPLDTRSVANATSCILPSLMVIHLNLCSGLN